MVIARPDGPDNDIPFRSVARPLLEVFRTQDVPIRLEVLRRPTFERLRQVLTARPNDYHVLHFDGHGTFPAGSGGFLKQIDAQGQLVFEDEAGGPSPVTGQQLGDLLRETGVRLVLLNACQSGMTDPAALYPSVGGQLLEAGIGGVVAMAYSVGVQTATRFMALFYEAFVGGQEFAHAVTLARRRLWSEPLRKTIIGEVPFRDWVVPLVMANGPLQLVPELNEVDRTGVPAVRAAPPRRQNGVAAFVGTPLLAAPATGFVGRDGSILELERSFFRHHLVHLRGMVGVGKTQFAIEFGRWHAATGNLGGPVAYVSLAECRGLESLRPYFGAGRRDVGPDGQAVAALQPYLVILDDADPALGDDDHSGRGWPAADRAGLVSLLTGDSRRTTNTLIITRRGHLPRTLGEEQVTLDGLKGSEAADLVARLWVTAPESETRASAELLEFLNGLGGNPLLIERLVPEAAAKTPAAVLRVLQSGSLAELSPAAGVPLANALGAAFDRLDQETRKKLTVLAYFQGFVDVQALNVVSHFPDAPDVIRGLDRPKWLEVLRAGRGCRPARAPDRRPVPRPPRSGIVSAGGGPNGPGLPLENMERLFIKLYADVGQALRRLLARNPDLAAGLARLEKKNLLFAQFLALERGNWQELGRIFTGLHQLYRLQGRWQDLGVQIDRIMAAIVRDDSPLPGASACGPTCSNLATRLLLPVTNGTTPRSSRGSSWPSRRGPAIKRRARSRCSIWAFSRKKPAAWIRPGSILASASRS